MKSRLIIDGNAVYEVDENCKKKQAAASTGKNIFANDRKQRIQRREAQEGKKRER